MGDLSKRKRTVLAALTIAKGVIYKELCNPSGMTQETLERLEVDQSKVDIELEKILEYLTKRELRNDEHCSSPF